MQNFYKLFCLLIFCFFCAVSQNLLAQPPNDECSGAIDISDAFAGTCGDVTLNGPFTLTGSSPGVDDPPEPGENETNSTQPDGPFCPDETDPNLFGDASEIWENSVWYTWTVPDLNGDGSPVAYSIWTTDGSFGDDCGINPNDPLGGDGDTQVAIYEGADCPNSSTGECDHFAANEDLFTSEPWISGWLTLEFVPGETYYMAVDGWDGVQGEFCLTVVICGVECGDNECAPVETYCECEDCQIDADGNPLCTFGNIAPIGFTEDDPSTENDESGFFFEDDLDGNIFFCSEFVNGFSGANTYLGFGALNWTDCTGAASSSINLTLSAGQFTAGATDNGDGTVSVPTGSLLYIELTPDEISDGSITISSSVPDGIGNTCDETITLNFADFPQATDPFCVLSCFAGGIDTDILDNGVVACDGQNFIIRTDGLEQLDLSCASDDNSPYIYAWRLRADLYGTGDFAVVSSWMPLGPVADINPAEFFIDEFGYVGPYYTPGYPILPNTVPLQVQGAALCLNADGSVVDGCLASNEGYESSFFMVTYLPAGDAGCPADCLSGIFDCAGVCDGNAVEDCAGECGGSAIQGTACTDINGEESVYGENCVCIEVDTIVPPNNDECDTAPDISSAFTEECERIGPFDQTGASIADVEPPLPACFLDGFNSTTWYKFTVPDGIGGGQPTGYSISTGVFEDCGATNPLGGDNWDTQIAVYADEGGCPGASSVPLACNDDTPSLPQHPEVSSLEINLQPGDTYYIMVETFGTLDGEFCFYVAPTAKDTCVDCGDNSCTEVFGEDFTSCPMDCPCVGEFLFNTIDEATGFPILTMDPVALCPEDVNSDEEDGLYILFSLTSDNVPVGSDNITYDGSTLTTSVGTIFNFVFGGAPTSPPTAEGTKNVTMIYLTQAEVDAGVTPVVTFTDASGMCIITGDLNAPLNPDECEPIQPICSETSSSIELADGSDATSICVNDGVDEPIEVNVATAGTGDNSAWVITDLPGNVLALPDAPPFVLDGAGEGECLIWMVNWCGELSETLAVGVNVPSVVTTSDAAISNSLTVVRETCLEGCTDMNACNYNPDAQIEDGSCTEADCAGDCGGSAVEDCAGVCGGDAVEDCAGVCGGDAIEDCAGVCGGDAVEDCAGVCGGDAVEDCAGVCGGDAVEDCAGVCGGDAVEDCAGVCGGDAVVDCAGVCGGDAVTDCAGVCGGDAVEDCAGVCGGDAIEDCAGVCGGDSVVDCNGVCGGDAVAGAACEINGMAGTLDMDCVCQEDPVGCMDSSACNFDPDAIIAGPCEFEDCAGVCGGDAVEDCAGVCGGDAVEDCAGVCGGDAVLDCAGVCGGDAVADCAGVCGGDAVADCAGVCGGDAVEDCAGVCGGDAIAGAPCTDANGNTSAYLADCSCPEAAPTCQDMTACNFDQEGDCNYPETGFDCDGNCIDGLDCAGVCGGSTVAGSPCTDANGNPSAYLADCSCPEAASTCQDMTACNFDEEGDCNYPATGFDCDGNAIGGTTCIDANACNNGEDGDCQYPNPGFDCAGNCIDEGNACDDGNPNTNNDVINANCVCAGTPPVGPCASEAGTISLADGGEYSSMGFICDGNQAIITASDFILLPGQAVCYVFHEDGVVSSTNPLQNPLQFGSFFTNNGLGKKEIYATAFGAVKMANGSPDYTDPCITFSNTITITLLNPVNINIVEQCEADKGEFNFNITVTGGLPECVPSKSFEITGDYWNGTLAHGQTQPVGPIQDAENYTVTATDENGCTNTVSESVNCTKLPIELITFDGEALEEGNLLKWVTATEIENDFYTIESSTNGVDFEMMNTVKGQGNTSEASSYVYLDRTAGKGVTYYRLSQTDFDGTTAEVGVVAIERGETSFNITDLYPIPTSDFINLDFMAPEQSVIDIEVFDLIGKTMETLRTTSVGSNLLKIEVSDYPVGVYFISISSSEHKVTQKFVVE